MFGKEKHQKAPEDVPGIAGEPSYLKPKAGIAVTDANPTVTSVVAFERKALKNSAFKFTASEATILNVKSFKGYTAQVGRVDGAQPSYPVDRSRDISDCHHPFRCHQLLLTGDALCNGAAYMVPALTFFLKLSFW